ncbi:hypothetical protein B0I00_2513 [Novosphingobium kunmingense]|uniref:Uncharacterized protein n=1 Tax=Novosphingobium kunmingense TaxID=1211806 RepID=A0A2N0H7K1_9SPHN|nr:hypothetical protein [Novosphingobium kunmingense]PKB14911.1 hypothetical protein B0I00_2513 [Novosphingobium kunmingense]
MFGPSIFSVFRSRWRALWWAGSILLLAYCSVPAAEETAAPQASASDMAAVADALKAIDEAPSE